MLRVLDVFSLESVITSWNCLSVVQAGVSGKALGAFHPELLGFVLKEVFLEHLLFPENHFCTTFTHHFMASVCEEQGFRAYV